MVTIGLAANDHVWLHTESRREALRIGLLLVFRYGFWRWGPWIPAVTDQAVYPDFRRGRLRVESGWDNWVGFHFLSRDADTDAFLRRFASRHLEKSRRVA